MWVLSLIASYIGYLSTKEYLAFPSELTYSTGVVSLTLYSFIMLRFCLSGLYFFVKGQRMSDKHQKVSMMIILSGFLLLIIYGFSFKVFFISKVKSKGYYTCAGITSGWMPGMATKYMKEKGLCERAR
ncbi:hypothetical protein [Pantoea agglomerans]